MPSLQRSLADHPAAWLRVVCGSQFARDSGFDVFLGDAEGGLDVIVITQLFVGDGTDGVCLEQESRRADVDARLVSEQNGSLALCGTGVRLKFPGCRSILEQPNRIYKSVESQAPGRRIPLVKLYPCQVPFGIRKILSLRSSANEAAVSIIECSKCAKKPSGAWVPVRTVALWQRRSR